MRGLHKLKMDKLASDLEVSEGRVAQTLECEIKRPRDVDFLGIPLRCRQHESRREKNHTSTKAAENDPFTVVVDMGSTKEIHGGPTKHIFRDNVKGLTFSSLDRQIAFGRTDCASVVIKENCNVINRAPEESTHLAKSTSERNLVHHGGGPKERTKQQLHKADKVALVEHGQQEDIGTTRVRIQGSDMQVAKSPAPTKNQLDTPGEKSAASVGAVKSDATCYDDGDDMYLDFGPYSPDTATRGLDDSMSDDSELEKPVFGNMRLVTESSAATSHTVECNKSRTTSEKASRTNTMADKQLLSLLLLTNPKDLLSETAHCHTQDTPLLGNRSKRTEEENIEQRSQLSSLSDKKVCTK